MLVVNYLKDCFGSRNSIHQKPKEEIKISTDSAGLFDATKNENLQEEQHSDSLHMPLLRADNSELVNITAASIPIQIPSPKNLVKSAKNIPLRYFYFNAKNEINSSNSKIKKEMASDDIPIKTDSHQENRSRERTETPSQMFENENDSFYIFPMDTSF